MKILKTGEELIVEDFNKSINLDFQNVMLMAGWERIKKVKKTFFENKQNQYLRIYFLKFGTKKILY